MFRRQAPTSHAGDVREVAAATRRTAAAFYDLEQSIRRLHPDSMTISDATQMRRDFLGTLVDVRHLLTALAEREASRGRDYP